MEPTGTLSERFMGNKSRKSINAWAKLKLTSDIIICTCQAFPALMLFF